MDDKPDKRCSGHPNSDIELTVTPEQHHYGRWTCVDCGKFITWAKKPKTTESMREMQRRIREMICHPEFRVRCTEKEIHNLLKMYNKPHLNPYDQNQCVDLIVDKLMDK